MAKRAVKLDETLTFDVKITLCTLKMKSDTVGSVSLDRRIDEIPRRYWEQVQKRAIELVAQHLGCDESEIESYIGVQGIPFWKKR